MIEATLEREKGIADGNIRASAVDSIRRQRQDIDERLRPGNVAATLAAAADLAQAAAEAEPGVELEEDPGAAAEPEAEVTAELAEKFEDLDEA